MALVDTTSAQPPDLPAPAPSLWTPLQASVFRGLWIASIASNVGTWLQSVGAAWLMTELTSSPFLISLVQAATTLPVFVFALPAGAIADIFDRRLVMLGAQVWMLSMAAALAAFTFSDAITPAWLLALTFGLGIGNAVYSPAWQAIVPNLVPRPQLRSAILLNSISMNASRAIGPAVGGVIVAAAGPDMAFLLNAVSFLGIILVLARWNRERPPSTNLPPEQFIGAILAGVRYVRHTPEIRIILWRALAFVSGAAALWALLPAIAREHEAWGPAGYGIFLGCMGCGAVTGIWTLNRPRQHLGSSWTVTLGGLLFGLSAALLAWVPSFGIRCLALFVAGGMWLSVMTTLNSAAQLILPEWVRAPCRFICWSSSEEWHLPVQVGD